MTGDSTPVRHDGVEWRAFGTDGMLLDPASGAYAQIDHVGMAIWEQVDGRKTVREIADVLASAFEAADDDVTDDVIAFLEALTVAGLMSFRR